MYKKLYAKNASILLQNLQKFLTFILLCAIIIIVKDITTAERQKGLSGDLMYKTTENISRAVNNQGEPIKFELYISTAKGKRRKWAGERETLNDINILIRQNYLKKGFEYISANIIVRFTTGHSLIERRYIKLS